MNILENFETIAYYPEYTYYLYKEGKQPCATIEVQVLKVKNKYIVIATDLLSVRSKKLKCKQSITNSYEYFIKDFFNKIKKENPDIKLKDFIWIEHYYERGDKTDSLPESYDLVTPINIEINEKGLIEKCKPSWKRLLMDDINPEKRKGLSINCLINKLEKLNII